MEISIPLLRRDHVHFSLILNMLDRQSEVLERGVKNALPLIRLGLKYFRDYPRKIHHPKEDLIYGALRHHMVRGTDALFNAVEEHAEIDRELAAMATASQSLETKDEGAVRGFCERLRRFITRERLHMEMEEGHLYPAAVHMLTPEEWQAIADSCTDEKDPVFSDEVSASFDLLLADILMKDSATRKSDA